MTTKISASRLLSSGCGSNLHHLLPASFRDVEVCCGCKRRTNTLPCSLTWQPLGWVDVCCLYLHKLCECGVSQVALVSSLSCACWRLSLPVAGSTRCNCYVGVFGLPHSVMTGEVVWVKEYVTLPKRHVVLHVPCEWVLSVGVDSCVSIGLCVKPAVT